MVAQPFGEGNELLTRIREGMAVVDATGEPVGTVRRVYRGAGGPVAATAAGDPALGDVPDDLRAHLAKSGFVEIDAGPLQVDRYATGAQVAALEGGGVRLSVGKDTLARK